MPKQFEWLLRDPKPASVADGAGLAGSVHALNRARWRATSVVPASVVRRLGFRLSPPGQAVRQGDIRAALQRHKGVSLAYTSIRHALGQLEARKAVEQDGGQMAGRIGGSFLTIGALQCKKLTESAEAGPISQALDRPR